MERKAAAGKREGLARLCGALAALLWLAALATGLTRLAAGSPTILGAAMRAFAPPEATGLPEAEYAGVARMTAGYLTGSVADFQYRLPDDTPCFQAHEAAHMADCRSLIALAGAVCAGTAAGGCALYAAARAAEGRGARRETRRGIRRGVRLFAAGAAALLLWAALDFDGFFVTFHRLAFTNDGWLLDPRTDLLIRLMPTPFFMALGAGGLAVFAAGAAALYAAARERR